jgi:hypothetical protein
MSIVAPARKPLGVRATAEQHRILTEAAAREHRSVSSFVLSAAMKAAEAAPVAKPKRSVEEIRAILEAARAAVREANPAKRDLLAELFAERREAAAHGE